MHLVTVYRKVLSVFTGQVAVQPAGTLWGYPIQKLLTVRIELHDTAALSLPLNLPLGEAAPPPKAGNLQYSQKKSQFTDIFFLVISSTRAPAIITAPTV